MVFKREKVTGRRRERGSERDTGWKSVVSPGIARCICYENGQVGIFYESGKLQQKATPEMS